VWKSRSVTSSVTDPGLSQLAELNGNRSLQHVFTILCLSLDIDEVERALRALGTNDTQLRGTALEYLENVIPGDLKPVLWPRLTDQRAALTRSMRSRRELATELKRRFSG